MAELVIVESPGKIRKISKILGPRYRVAASLGHVRDLPVRPSRGRFSDQIDEASLGLRLDGSWSPSWEILDGKESVVKKLQAAAGRKDPVWLATDLDREGEAIAWHLQELLGGSGDRFRRVTFSEISAPALEKAFAAPRTLDRGLVDAQLARRFLDRLVGFTVSPLLSRRLRAGLSAGRVQSAALSILCSRDEAIRVFRAAAFYEVAVDLPVDGASPVRAFLVDANARTVRFDDPAAAAAAVSSLQQAAITIASVEASDQKQNPPPPFTTSTLQQAASSRLKSSVSQTMAAAQKLYEAGAITYMRSDSVALAPEAVQAAREYLTQAFPGVEVVPARPPVFSAKAGAQEAHEAIRPAAPGLGPDDLEVTDPGHLRLYDLIRRRMLASQMVPAQLRRTDWKLAAEAPGGETLRLAARGRVVVDPGWHRVLPPVSSADDPDPMPPLATGHRWEPGTAAPQTVTGWTKPPARFTEAALVAELEKAGVGRPSTYAATLDTLQRRGYVLTDGRVFVVTPMGRLVVHHLRRCFPGVCDPAYTSGMEEQLDRVAAGSVPYRALLDHFWKGLGVELEAGGADPAMTPAPYVSLDGLCCPKCGSAASVMLFRRAVSVSCRRRCSEPAAVEYSPLRAARKSRKKESGEEAAAEQAAADQRAGPRCSRCSGVVQRWASPWGGFLHLCGAWPLCTQGRFEAGKAPAKKRASSGSSAKRGASAKPRTAKRRKTARK